MSDDEILSLEYESAQAWPSLEDGELGGWLLRAANGYTGRANSVYPLGEPGTEVEDAVKSVRQWYAVRGLRPRFKLTEAGVPSGLDPHLSSVGFELAGGGIVMSRPLAHPSSDCAASGSIDLDEAWLNVYLIANGMATSSVPTIRTMLSRILLPHIFAGHSADDRVVSCALGVIVADNVWLFDIATLPEFRRKGCAEANLSQVFEWASQNGATKATLQVAPTNEPAIRLYKRLGFRELYRYWYRLDA